VLQDPYRNSPYDTAVFVLQTQTGAAKWPVDAAAAGGGGGGGGGRGGGGGGGAAEGGGGGGGGGAAEGGGGGEAPMDIDGQQPPSACSKPPSKDGRKNRQMYNLHVPRQRLRQRLLESLAPGTGQKTENRKQKRNTTQFFASFSC
jgi:hypothetical protein